MRQIKSNARVINEDVTLIVRIIWERLCQNDMKKVFGAIKAKQWVTGETNFTRLWYYATAIEQDHLLEIMNGYIENQSIHVSRGEQL